MAKAVDVSVLVPVKAFRQAKARLAPALTPNQRAVLARQMASRVVDAARGLDVWVVCDDDEVAEWARGRDANVSWQPAQGLNAAVTAAARHRFTAGIGRVAVVHGDLPLIASLDWLLAPSSDLILVPDRHRDGTNLISTPSADFRFAYGPGSFARHVAESSRLGLSLSIVRDNAIEWDVDVPEDLAATVGLDPM